jgi:hypothetical protein
VRQLVSLSLTVRGLQHSYAVPSERSDTVRA